MDACGSADSDGGVSLFAQYGSVFQQLYEVRSVVWRMRSLLTAEMSGNVVNELGYLPRLER